MSKILDVLSDEYVSPDNNVDREEIIKYSVNLGNYTCNEKSINKVNYLFNSIHNNVEIIKSEYDTDKTYSTFSKVSKGLSSIKMYFKNYIFVKDFDDDLMISVCRNSLDNVVNSYNMLLEVSDNFKLPSKCSKKDLSNRASIVECLGNMFNIIVILNLYFKSKFKIEVVHFSGDGRAVSLKDVIEYSGKKSIREILTSGVNMDSLAKRFL